MPIQERTLEFIPLDLPEEFEGLEGLISADLHAIVAMVVQRAHERLYLTGREHQRLQAELWNGLTEAVNNITAPLTIESR